MIFLEQFTVYYNESYVLYIYGDDFGKEENDEKEDTDKENRQRNSEASDILKEKERAFQESSRALNSL